MPTGVGPFFYPKGGNTMKTIGSIKDLLNLPSDLTMFILSSCPWMAEPWEAESIGYVFVLDEGDVHEVCTVPHLEESDNMTIDLETFDLWEVPAIFDSVSGYWNVVAILGQEYGCTLFMSSGFVLSIPELHRRLLGIKEVR
jgi:hypothetical protein